MQCSTIVYSAVLAVQYSRVRPFIPTQASSNQPARNIPRRREERREEGERRDGRSRRKERWKGKERGEMEGGERGEIGGGKIGGGGYRGRREGRVEGKKNVVCVNWLLIMV